MKKRKELRKSIWFERAVFALSLFSFSIAFSAQKKMDLNKTDESELPFYESKSSGVSNGFQIPIFNESDFQSKVVKDVETTQAIEDVSLNKRSREKKTSQVLILEKKLEQVSILPFPKYDFGKEKKIKRKTIKYSQKKIKLLSGFSLNKQKVEGVSEGFEFARSLKIQKAFTREVKLKSIKQEVVSESDADQIKPEYKSNFQFSLKKMDLQGDKDLELLTADILFTEKGSCEEVVPLTEFLKGKKVKDNRVDFYRGSCLHDYKMYSESIPLLSHVIGTSTDYYAEQAVSKILTGLPKGYEQVIAKGLAPKKVYKKLKQKQKDKYNYILAKGNFINEKYKKSVSHAKLVSTKSPDYYDAQFTVGISYYMSGNLRMGIKTLMNLQKSYSKFLKKNEEFESLIQVTLGRYFFERGAYKEAVASYNKVRRNHPLWVDSLVEKGWAQIKLKDYKGAIGNMYTLQSPFFKDAFIPESHVIRTIGYLNLCQFGDANHALNYLEVAYPDQKKQIQTYIKSSKSHYNTLSSYLGVQNHKSSVFDGLPTSIIREMGRDRDYLVLQTKLNNIVDEIPMFRKFAKQIIVKIEQFKAKIQEYSNEAKQIKVKQLKASQNNKTELAKSLEEERVRIFNKGRSLQYRINTFKKGIAAYKKENGNSIKRAEKMRDEYLNAAENTLQKSLASTESRLDLVLRNNDLLRYEVYANSGKNIRYRTAGGAIGPSKMVASASRAPSNKKNYNWGFQGEFWEDEIGKFRSQLKNLCPSR